MSVNPWEAVAEVAREYIGTRETSRNRGPHLAEFWAATSYPTGETDRQPWCSAFVSFCVSAAILRGGPACALSSPPRFAAVSSWLPWALSCGAELVPPARVRAGDVVVFHFSHIGIATGETDAARRRLTTVEGNTDAAGGREGDAVAQKNRPWREIRAIIRLPVVAVRA